MATPWVKNVSIICALKGQHRKTTHFIDVALSGRKLVLFIAVGRCPTLGYFALSELFIENYFINLM